MNKTVTLSRGQTMPYIDMLESTQRFVSANYSAEIPRLKKDDYEQLMFEIVRRSLINQNYFDPSDNRLKAAANEITEDMAGMSFLSRYLNHLEDHPDLEEINGNMWNSIVFKKSGGHTEFTNESFLSPQHSVDVIRRIIEKHGAALDESKPEVTADISNNIRITAKIYPIIPEEFGAVFSIRITRPHTITDEKLIESGSVSPEIIDFLKFCVKYLVSMVFSGKMYAGKTTMMNFFAKMIDKEKRIYLIEEGSRELSLIEYDEDSRMKNQVIPNLTFPSTIPDQNYDASPAFILGFFVLFFK